MLRQIIASSIFLFICFPAESLTVYGHRGARGLAPENTLPAFHEALKQHVDYIDLDVVMTSDGVLVAHHDLTLNTDITRDASLGWVEGEHVIKTLTLAELQTYDVGRMHADTPHAAIYKHQKPVDGTHIPTLRAVIREMKATADYSVGFQIEIKTDPTLPHLSAAPDVMAIALDAVIREEGVSARTKVQAYDWRALFLLQQLNPEIETAYLTDIDHEKILRHISSAVAGQWTGGYLLKDYYDSIPQMIKALGGTWWDVEDIELAVEQLNQAHQLGLKVAVWSYPERTGQEINMKLIERLIAMPVDGVITDRPDIVINFLKEMQHN
ncbi:MAG: glycerophosphodiester phosphodiesterase [Gammaproteobacteria bacterium]|nr:glycerophosphodiester phosphodiesterase [Gammaproteobacteria bacterium]